MQDFFLLAQKLVASQGVCSVELVMTLTLLFSGIMPYSLADINVLKRPSMYFHLQGSVV